MFWGIITKYTVHILLICIRVLDGPSTFIYLFAINTKTLQTTRKSCSETNTKAALRYRSTTIFVKYEEAEIHRSAIMQHFRDGEKTNKIKN